jgi:hypothetical protein
LLFQEYFEDEKQKRDKEKTEVKRAPSVASLGASDSIAVDGSVEVPRPRAAKQGSEKPIEKEETPKKESEKVEVKAENIDAMQIDEPAASDSMAVDSVSEAISTPVPAERRQNKLDIKPSKPEQPATKKDLPPPAKVEKLPSSSPLKQSGDKEKEKAPQVQPPRTSEASSAKTEKPPSPSPLKQSAEKEKGKETSAKIDKPPSPLKQSSEKEKEKSQVQLPRTFAVAIKDTKTNATQGAEKTVEKPPLLISSKVASTNTRAHMDEKNINEMRANDSDEEPMLAKVFLFSVSLYFY